jgi:hypothetical protein
MRTVYAIRASFASTCRPPKCLHKKVHRDQRPATYIMAIPGPLFILSPQGTLFLISCPGTHAHCHIYLIYVHIWYSLQILFTLGIWLFCVQVLGHHRFTSVLQVYLLKLACSLSRCIAFTSPVTPSDLGL